MNCILVELQKILMMRDSDRRAWKILQLCQLCVCVCLIKGMTAIMIKYLRDQNDIEKIRQIDVLMNFRS